MNTEEIKKEIVYSENLHRLFEISIELTEEISECHKELIKTEDNMKRTEIKGQIALLSTLKNIIEKRTALQRDNERKKMLKYRQFVSAAKIVLSESTYERIRELSNKNYKEFREFRNGLESEKLE